MEIDRAGIKTTMEIDRGNKNMRNVTTCAITHIAMPGLQGYK